MKSISLLGLLMLTVAGAAQDQFPDLDPAVRPELAIHEFESKLKSFGWRHGPSGFRNQVLTRSQMAHAAIETIRALKSHLQNEIESSHKVTAPSDRDFLATELLQTAKKWIDEFRGEIRRFASYEELRTALEECKPLVERLVAQYDTIQAFPDVPQSHWAAKSVTRLKKAGILKGYPDGKFRG